MENKGITLISILIIIAIIAGVGVLGYLGYQQWFDQKQLIAEDYAAQSACEKAGYHWYNKSCHKEEKKSKESIKPSVVCSYSKTMIGSPPSEWKFVCDNKEIKGETLSQKYGGKIISTRGLLRITSILEEGEETILPSVGAFNLQYSDSESLKELGGEGVKVTGTLEWDEELGAILDVEGIEKLSSKNKPYLITERSITPASQSLYEGRTLLYRIVISPEVDKETLKTKLKDFIEEKAKKNQTVGKITVYAYDEPGENDPRASAAWISTNQLTKEKIHYDFYD